MKNLFLSILLAIITVYSVAQTNNLVVFTLESKPFYVILNGIRQNTDPETNVKITDLAGDFYRLRIIFQDKEIPSIDKSIYYDKMGQQYNMEVVKRRRGYRARMAGWTNIDNENEAEGQVQITYHDTENNTTNTTQNEQTNTNENNQSSSTQENHQNSTNQQENASVNININENGVNVAVHSSEEENNENATHQNSDNNNGGQQNGSEEITYNFMPNGSMCPSPSISQQEYMDFRYSIEEVNMFKREETIINYIKMNCLTTEQVAGIIRLDYSTVKAYEVAKHAYRNTWDTENYEIVINELKSENDRKKLINFLDIGTTNTHETNNNQNSEEEESTTVNSGSGIIQTKPTQEENYNPLVVGYSGRIGCDGKNLINIDEVNAAAKKETFAKDQLQVIQQASKNRCFSVNHLMTLSNLFTHESDKMKLIEWAYDKTYDIDDYYKLMEVFINSSNKKALNNFIQQQPDPNIGTVEGSPNIAPVPNYSGKVGSFDPIININEVKNLVDKQTFTKDKMNVLKQATANRALTVEQFITLSETFSHEKDIIDFAKFAYPRVYDQDNFYKVNEILTFSSSKDKLNEIIK